MPGAKPEQLRPLDGVLPVHVGPLRVVACGWCASQLLYPGERGDFGPQTSAGGAWWSTYVTPGGPPQRHNVSKQSASRGRLGTGRQGSCPAGRHGRRVGPPSNHNGGSDPYSRNYSRGIPRVPDGPGPAQSTPWQVYTQPAPGLQLPACQLPALRTTYRFVSHPAEPIDDLCRTTGTSHMAT